MIDDAGHNMAHLLVGSEGTLAFFTEIELDLQPIPPHRVLGICHFPSFYAAMEATQHDRQAGPRRGRAGRPHDDRAGARQSRCSARSSSASSGASPRRSCSCEFAGEDADDNLRRLEAARRADGRSRLSRRRHRGDRPRLPERGVERAQGRPQHHDVDEGRREAGLVHRGLRGAARGSGRIHRRG